MLDWINVVEDVVNTLGTKPQGVDSMLEFLHVLPEEVTEGRKINLSVCDYFT